MSLFQKTQITELVVLCGKCHKVHSTAFLTKDCFQNLTSIDVENCCVIDGTQFIDIAATLPELKILKMRRSNILQYNLVQLSKKAKKIKMVDMHNCQPFLFSSAHICVWNFIHLEMFLVEMKYPPWKIESGTWWSITFPQRWISVKVWSTHWASGNAGFVLTQTTLPFWTCFSVKSN